MVNQRNMHEFKDQVIVVSGALGDIGLAITTAYLAQGATVVMGDVLPESEVAEKLVTLTPYQDHFEYKHLDVADDQQVAAWMQAVVAKYCKINHCISNAAKVTIKDFKHLTPQEWRNEMNVNLDGAYYFANFAVSQMVASATKGSVVFLGSWAAHAVHQSLPAYSVSKAAVRMLAQTMALEYAPNGIRVNELAPGYVNAGLSKTVWAQLPQQKQLATEKVPLGKIMEADEVAAQVLWLTSNQCQHVTGATFLMDGGLSLLRP